MAGIIFLAAALWVRSVIGSSLLGVTAFSCFWSIKEVNEQVERVRKGRFPANPKRAGSIRLTDKESNILQEARRKRLIIHWSCINCRTVRIRSGPGMSYGSQWMWIPRRSMPRNHVI